MKVQVISPVVWTDATEFDGATHDCKFTTDFPTINWTAVAFTQIAGVKPVYPFMVIEIDESACALVNANTEYFVLDDCETDNLATWLKTNGVPISHKILADVNPGRGDAGRKTSMANFYRQQI